VLVLTELGGPSGLQVARQKREGFDHAAFVAAFVYANLGPLAYAQPLVDSLEFGELSCCILPPHRAVLFACLNEEGAGADEGGDVAVRELQQLARIGFILFCCIKIDRYVLGGADLLDSAVVEERRADAHLDALVEGGQPQSALAAL